MAAQVPKVVVCEMSLLEGRSELSADTVSVLNYAIGQVTTPGDIIVAALYVPLLSGSSIRSALHEAASAKALGDPSLALKEFWFHHPEVSSRRRVAST